MSVQEHIPGVFLSEQAQTGIRCHKTKVAVNDRSDSRQSRLAHNPKRYVTTNLEPERRGGHYQRPSTNSEKPQQQTDLY